MIKIRFSYMSLKPTDRVRNDTHHCLPNLAQANKISRQWTSLFLFLRSSSLRICTTWCHIESRLLSLSPGPYEKQVDASSNGNCRQLGAWSFRMTTRPHTRHCQFVNSWRESGFLCFRRLLVQKICLLVIFTCSQN